MTRLPVPLLLLVVLVSGCSGGGDAPSASGSASAGDGAAPDRAAIQAGLATVFAGDHPSAQDREDGACFARELAARATPVQLRDAGVLGATYAVVEQVPPLPSAMAETWADAQQACVDFVEASARAQAKVTHGAIDTEGYAACLRDALSPHELRAAQVATLTGDFGADALQQFSDAQATCVQGALSR